MQKSPFKFLDSFTKEDREIFFGRDKEIEELHSRVYESKILLVYGTSGTGKSSLINCGLANKFNDSDWLPVNIRRGSDINVSLFDALSKTALTKVPFEKASKSTGISYNLEKLLRSVYLDHFKPIFLIFDQFEELFIFGSNEERNELIRNVAGVIDSDIQCRFIFSLREEYLAGVTEFEKVIPAFLSNRIRIEKMTRQNAIQTIEGPCRVNNIEIEAGFAEALLEKLNPDSPEVELTWLQVFLDKIMRLAAGDEGIVKRISNDLLTRLGDVKDILGAFLEEQVSRLSDPETGLVILKSFVSVKGTKHQITEGEVIEYSRTFGKEIDNEIIKELIQKFTGLRILRDKDENGRYELRHDSLALKIFEKITLVEKELLEIKYFVENAYANFEKRDLLLSEEDLKYIAPYEDKLFLNEKTLSFISQSKRELHKARRRRQNVLIAAAGVIFTILSFFTIWAMHERGNAIKLRQIAVSQKDEALKAKTEADAAKMDADISRQKAEDNEKIALDARNQSEIAREEALSAKENAVREKTRAEQMTLLANEQARNAQKEKQIADQQRILAQTAEEKAKRLSLLSTAQNLALISQALEKKQQIMGLLAVQAFNFNVTSGGYENDPVIFKALNKAFSVLDSSKQSVLAGSLNEVRSLAINNNSILGADLDGNILQWNSDGKFVSVPNERLSSYINFISLSPSGKMMITDYENNSLILTDVSGGNQKDIGLTGHTGPIKAASWSSDGNKLATGGSDSLILVWGTGSSGSAPIKLKGGSAVRSLAFCGSDSLVSAYEDGSLRLWNIRNLSGEKLFESRDEKIICLAWDSLRRHLLAGFNSGFIQLFDFNENKIVGRRYASHSTGIDHLIFNKDFSIVATSAWDKSIRIYNYHEFFEMHNFVKGVVSIEDLDVRTRSLTFTGDNKLVAGMADKTVRIWETSSGKLASMICGIVKRDMLTEEWNEYIGPEIPYEKTCQMNH